MMKKSQRLIVGLVLNWSLKSVRVGTATTQQEVSSALPPPLCGAPKFGGGRGEGSKRSRMLRNFQGSAALPCVSTGGRWYASWPPAGPGGQGESGDSALQQQTLEEALFGARLCDLYGSAPSGWAAVILLESKGAEMRSGQLRVGARQKCCRTWDPRRQWTYHLPVESAHDVSGQHEESLQGATTRNISFWLPKKLAPPKKCHWCFIYLVFYLMSVCFFRSCMHVFVRHLISSQLSTLILTLLSTLGSQILSHGSRLSLHSNCQLSSLHFHLTNLGPHLISSHLISTFLNTQLSSYVISKHLCSTLFSSHFISTLFSTLGSQIWSHLSALTSFQLSALFSSQLFSSLLISTLCSHQIFLGTRHLISTYLNVQLSSFVISVIDSHLNCQLSSHLICVLISSQFISSLLITPARSSYNSCPSSCVSSSHLTSQI